MVFQQKRFCLLVSQTVERFSVIRGALFSEKFSSRSARVQQVRFGFRARGWLRLIARCTRRDVNHFEGSSQQGGESSSPHSVPHRLFLRANRVCRPKIRRQRGMRRRSFQHRIALNQSVIGCEAVYPIPIHYADRF